MRFVLGVHEPQLGCWGVGVGQRLRKENVCWTHR